MHLWFDREITELDHAVLLDREIHWMYNKSELQPWRKTKGSYLELVVSASRAFAALEREAGHRPGARANWPSSSRGESGEARKGRAGQGSPRHLRRAPGHRRLAAAPRIALAELLPGRRLDRDRLALHDGKRRALRPPGRRSPLRRQHRNEPRAFLEPDLKPKGLMRFTGQSRLVLSPTSFAAI